MDRKKIEVCINLLEKLLDYDIKFVPYGNNSYTSNPKEKLEKTYSILSTQIDELTPELFHKTFSMVLGEETTSDTVISSSSLGYGNPEIRNRIINTLMVMKTQLFIFDLSFENYE